MELNILQDLNKLWASTYYTQLLLLITIVILFIQINRTRNKATLHFLFWIYSIIGLILFFVIDIYKICNANNANQCDTKQQTEDSRIPSAVIPNKKKQTHPMTN